MSKEFYNIVIVVCHPDDEVFWCGGLISELSKIDFIHIYVLCLSGADPNSPRAAEFEQAKQCAGYKDGVVLGFPLRPALQPLPASKGIILDGLRYLKIEMDQIDLILTHPPYGDEQMHPHHRQVHQEVRMFCSEKDIPFGYFSNLPINLFSLQPLQRHLKRMDSLHLLLHAECRYALSHFQRLLLFLSSNLLQCPRYYLLFSSDINRKRQMLDCYQSIDVNQHLKGYSVLTHSCEGIYLDDERAMVPFKKIIATMSVPGRKDLLEYVDYPLTLKQAMIDLASKIKRRILKWPVF